MSQAFTTHGAFSWCELMTSDPEAAEGFYSKVFGWELERNAMGHEGYTCVKAGGQPVGGILRTPPEAQGMPPAWSCYVTVKDVHETAKLAESLGAKLLMPPKEIEGVGTFCVLQDPQGAVLCAITYAPCSEPQSQAFPGTE